MTTAGPPRKPFNVDQSPLVPTRRFAPFYRRDELGFLDPERCGSLSSAEQILGYPAILVKALPWMGKTTFAQQMHGWLKSSGQSYFGPFLGLTSFEESVEGQQVLPGWWGEWKSSRPGTPACWIVDGLDECEHHHPGITNRIVREIGEVPEESHRPHLRLLILTRDRDWLGKFEQQLGQYYDNLGTK